MADFDSGGTVVHGIRFFIDSDLRAGHWRVNDGDPRGDVLTADYLTHMVEGSMNPIARISAAPDLRERLRDVAEGFGAKDTPTEPVAKVYFLRPEGDPDQPMAFGMGGLTEVQVRVAQRAIDGFADGKLIALVDPDDIEIGLSDEHTAFRAHTEVMAAAVAAQQFAQSLKPLSGVPAEDTITVHGTYHLRGAAYDLKPSPETVKLEGTVTIDDDDGALPDQPCIGGKMVTTHLLHGLGKETRPVRFRLEGAGDVGGSGDLLVGEGYADGHETDDPYLKIAGVDLLKALTARGGQEVTLVVEATGPIPSGEESPTPKTPEGDVAGKTRVALAAAKLIQLETHYAETPHGHLEHHGAPSRENSMVVTKLEEALMWAERDDDLKVDADDAR